MRIELYCTLFFYQERVFVIFLHFFLLTTQYIYIRYKITFPYWNYMNVFLYLNMYFNLVTNIHTQVIGLPFL